MNVAASSRRREAGLSSRASLASGLTPSAPWPGLRRQRHLANASFGEKLQLGRLARLTSCNLPRRHEQTLVRASCAGVARRERFDLDKAKTSTLLARSDGAGEIQPIDRMLTAVGFGLHAVTGRRTHCIALEGHGRELFDGAPDVSDSVGWYTTIHPVEVDLRDDLLLSVAGVRAARARVPNSGIGYGALRGAYGQAAAPLPPVSLNFL